MTHPTVGGLSERDELCGEIVSEQIVVFTSTLTDTRQLATRIAASGRPFREIRLGMGSSAMRRKFDALRRMTNWPYLPQIFVDGRFVGGFDEFEALRLQERTRRHGDRS